MGLTLNIDGCSVQLHKESCGWSDILTNDWTLSLCSLVVSALAQNATGIRFDSHQVFYTFQSYCVVEGVQKSKSKFFSTFIFIFTSRDYLALFPSAFWHSYILPPVPT